MNFISEREVSNPWQNEIFSFHQQNRNPLRFPPLHDFKIQWSLLLTSRLFAFFFIERLTVTWFCLYCKRAVSKWLLIIASNLTISLSLTLVRSTVALTSQLSGKQTFSVLNTVVFRYVSYKLKTEMQLCAGKVPNIYMHLGVDRPVGQGKVDAKPCDFRPKNCFGRIDEHFLVCRGRESFSTKKRAETASK